MSNISKYAFQYRLLGFPESGKEPIIMKSSVYHAMPQGDFMTPATITGLQHRLEEFLRDISFQKIPPGAEKVGDLTVASLMSLLSTIPPETKIRELIQLKDPSTHPNPLTIIARF